MILGFVNVKIRASVKAIWCHQKKCWVCPTSMQTFDVFICRHWVIFPLKSCTNGVSQRVIWTLLLSVDFCQFFYSSKIMIYVFIYFVFISLKIMIHILFVFVCFWVWIISAHHDHVSRFFTAFNLNHLGCIMVFVMENLLINLES